MCQLYELFNHGAQYLVELFCQIATVYTYQNIDQLKSNIFVVMVEEQTNHYAGKNAREANLMVDMLIYGLFFCLSFLRT